MRRPKSDEPTVLLVDPNPLTLHLRATVFRNCEIDVHTARSVEEATRLCGVWRYDIALLSADHNSERGSLVGRAIWRVSPRQRVALFVGPPAYLREMGTQEPRSAAERGHSTRRIHLVERQKQPAQWQALLDRLLAAG